MTLKYPLEDILGRRREVPIAECGERLEEIPRDRFDFFTPHPYMACGAPYGDDSPFALRAEVVERLTTAQALLEELRPGYKLKVFDGYRPVRVQEFMVEYTFRQLAREQGIQVPVEDEGLRKDLYDQVFQIWARPSMDPAAPPPHSTGAVIDLTISDERGQVIDMGSEIDAFPPLNYPDHYASATDELGKLRHANRELLNTVMTGAGFERLPFEWWHFSFGDQVWEFLRAHREERAPTPARYGRYDLAKSGSR